MFLITTNVPALVSEGPNFSFVPYDYGPFDRAVYDDASALKHAGLADIQPSGFGQWNVYAASAEGVKLGNEYLAGMGASHRHYATEISRWVRGQSFTNLVKSIYKAYPNMRANSIFRD